MVAVPSLGEVVNIRKIVFPAPSYQSILLLTSKETDATAKLFIGFGNILDLNTHYLINKKNCSARASMLC
jgi:hypothetical protein